MTKRSKLPAKKEEEDKLDEESVSESTSGDDDEYPEVSEADEDEDDEGDDTKQEEIVIDFEFFQPKEIDYHGLKALLFTYLDGQQYDTAGLVNAILKQDNVGSVVKTSEEDDPIAVFTVLNTVGHKEQEWMKQMQNFVAKSCKEESLKKKLAEAFSQEGTGLLVNERLINSPPKLAPPLMQFLFEEIKAASQDPSLPKTQREAFKFKRYLVITRVYADNDAPNAAAGPAGSSKKQKVTAGAGPSSEVSGGPVIVYLRPEDEFLQKHSSWSFTFPIEGRVVGKDDLQPLRMVMLVEAGRIPDVRRALDLTVGNMAAGH